MLVFDSASLGKLTKGEWEYFNSKAIPHKSTDTSSTLSSIRLVAIANSSDPDNKFPSARSQVGPGELARLYFYVGEKKSFHGKNTQLNFLWTKCDDNSFCDETGNNLYLSHKVISAEGADLKSPSDPHAGASAKCFQKRPNRPNPTARIFDFRDVKILIN